MTVTTNPSFDAVAASPVYGALYLVECQARSGTLRLTNWPLTVETMGQTWNGVGSLGKVGQLHESEDGAEEKLTLSLSLVDVGMRAFALGDPADYQERPVRVWLALLDAETLQIAGLPVLRFAGVMDRMSIKREDTSAEISMECRTASYDVRSNPAALRMNAAQHSVAHPEEKGFEYLNSMIGTPSVWLSKSAQMAIRFFASGRG